VSPASGGHSPYSSMEEEPQLGDISAPHGDISPSLQVPGIMVMLYFKKKYMVT
jgi:hypothetical protein